MWKKLIKRGEKVGLELTRAERKMLLTGLVFLHEGVEEAIRSTPPGEPVMITLGDLEDMAGHVAGEANHARSERTEEILSDIYEKIEELLDTVRRGIGSGERRLGSLPPSHPLITSWMRSRRSCRCPPRPRQSASHTRSSSPSSSGRR